MGGRSGGKTFDPRTWGQVPFYTHLVILIRNSPLTKPEGDSYDKDKSFVRLGSGVLSAKQIPYVLTKRFTFCFHLKRGKLPDARQT